MVLMKEKLKIERWYGRPFLKNFMMLDFLKPCIYITLLQIKNNVKSSRKKIYCKMFLLKITRFSNKSQVSKFTLVLTLNLSCENRNGEPSLKF